MSRAMTRAQRRVLDVLRLPGGCAWAPSGSLMVNVCWPVAYDRDPLRARLSTLEALEEMGEVEWRGSGVVREDSTWVLPGTPTTDEENEA